MHQYPITIDVLETIIRYGGRPNRPDLVNLYIANIETIIEHTSEQAERFLFAIRPAQLIYSAIADESISMSWRSVCADHIHLCIRLLKVNSELSHQLTQFKIFQYQFAALQSNA